jgi:hypothetical protein
VGRTAKQILLSILSVISNHFPMTRDTQLPTKRGRNIGVAWDRLSVLSRSGLDLLIPSHVLLQHFWLGLNKKAALQLDVAFRGSFTHKAMVEGEALLDRILENSP